MSGAAAAYSALGAAEIARLLRARELSAVEVAHAANDAIARLDGTLHAFAARDPERLVEDARALDRLDPGLAAELPLLGVPVAIKDIFDTAELATEYGSPIYRGHRPRADAAAVTLLRRAGALLAGKSKTTEFACMHPTDTRNPLASERTPGGSSSGSAAAVAAGLVPLATGSQTAGSVIRPASYCGVLGLKPTYGVVPLGGVLAVSSSLDTAGIFARSLDDLELALEALSAAPAGLPSARSSRPATLRSAARESSAPPQIVFARHAWERLEPSAREAVERYVEAVAGAGARVEENPSLGAELDRLAEVQLVIQQVETAWSLGAEADLHGAAVSDELRAYIAAGRAVSPDAYLSARRRTDEQRWHWQQALAPDGIVLAPGTLDAPPRGLSFTGDSHPCRAFTALGAPALALPGAWTSAGLPVGVQLAGPLHGDGVVLDAARWLLEHVGERRP